MLKGISFFHKEDSPIVTELFDIPEAVKSALEKKGISYDSVLIAAKTDLNIDCVPSDNYIFVTEGDIILLSGSMTGLPEKKSFFKHSSPVRDFEELSYDFHPIAKFESFKVEEMLSSARIVAKVKATEDSLPYTILIANLSNTFKSEAYKFVEQINPLIDPEKNGEKDESEHDGGHEHHDPHGPHGPHGGPGGPGGDMKEELFCPKCGKRYADPERKICPRCMDKVHILKRFSGFFFRYKGYLALIFLTLILTSGIGVLSPYISSGFYYDEVLSTEGKFYGQLLLVIGIILATRIISMIVNIINSYITSIIAARVTYDLKKEIFKSIERLSISYFTNRQTGGLMTQVNRDANNIYFFFCDTVPYFLVNAFQIIGILFIMFMMNWKLTVISLALVPIVAILIKKLFDQMEKFHAKRFSASRSLNSLLSDVLTGIRVVKAFSKEDAEADRFKKRNQSVAEADKKASLYNSTAFPIVNFLLYIGNILILGIGGWMVIKGEITYGMLLTFTSYMNMIYSPMMFFIDVVYMVTDSLNSMNRLSEIMDAIPDVAESEHPVSLGEVKGHVEFKNVEFSYEKNRKIIDGVSFDIEPGKIIGIVGHTGAGKSTLANLLIRLYDVGSGEIKIDGVNVKDIPFNELRKNIAIVSQETYLFMGTIKDNIKYACPDASDEDVITASKIAGAHDFIIKLPDGYDTKIGFGYKDLSGGERQRVSIARAILLNPRILIMDEATAAMDTQTERQIQTALEQLIKGRTTIMIAHRLSTLRDADHLIVIENGKMPEFGTHAELIRKKGIYYGLYKMQMEALRNIGIES